MPFGLRKLQYWESEPSRDASPSREGCVLPWKADLSQAGSKEHLLPLGGAVSGAGIGVFPPAEDC